MRCHQLLKVYRKCIFIYFFLPGVSAIGMVEKQVHSVEEGLLLLEKGNSLRSVGSTAMNQHSSRSHALIYLNVKVWFCVCFGNL